MSEIVESSAPVLKKLGKNKILLFGGLGAVAGIVVLAMKGAGKQQSAMVAETGASGDQAVSAIGSQMQAFEQAYGESNASMTAQIDSLTAQLETVGGNVSTVTESLTEFQKTNTETQKAITDQLIELQHGAAVAAAAAVSPVVTIPTVAPIQPFISTLSTDKATSSDGTYTGTSSAGYTSVNGVRPDPVLNTRGEYMFTNVSPEAAEAFRQVNGNGPGLGYTSTGTRSSIDRSTGSRPSSSSQSGEARRSYSNDGSRFTSYDSSGRQLGTYDSSTGRGIAGSKDYGSK
ncbi:MAG: hypothetical protein Q8904_15065 [Bacteroidota bacterium]|nr:hypothetical protein [Bacteroidota bacterium]